MQALRESALLWSSTNIILPKGKRWSFTGERTWQRALFQDPALQLVLRKAAQVGMSTTAVCRMLHFLVYNPVYAMYTLPRRDDVNDFVALYVDPIISNSPWLRRAREFSSEKQVDNTRIKQFKVTEKHSSFVIFMEASVEPRMVPVDFMINDEIDRSDKNNIEIFNARQADSEYKINYKFSTPTLEGAGIDPYFLASSQNYWHVRCRHCNNWNMLDWDMNFREPSASFGPRLACTRCDETITPEDIVGGQWVSMGPRGEGVASGYQISNLLLPYSRPIEKIWGEFRRAASVKNFYNLVLGLPYRTSRNSFSFSAFKNNSFDSPYESENVRASASPYFVGIDQGNDLHVVVAKAHQGRLRVIAAKHFRFDQKDAFERAQALIASFDAVTIIDSEPNRHSARDLQNEFPRGRVYLNKYGSYREEFSYGKGEMGGESGLVNISRTEAFDDLRDAVSLGLVQLWGTAEPMDPRVGELITHCLNIKRDEITQTTKGVTETRAVWVRTGPDHYAHALLFAYLAWKYVSSRRYGAVGVGLSSEQESAIIEDYERLDNELMEHVRELQEADATEFLREMSGTQSDGRPLRIA